MLKTGQQISIHFGTLARTSKVTVDGNELQGVRDVKIETNYKSGVTILSLDCIFPYPPELDPITRQVRTQTFNGYFVEERDIQAFLEWKRAMRKQED